MKNHHEVCEAAICQCDHDPDFMDQVIWYPGEKVCQKRPFKKFQKKQRDINRWAKKKMFKNIDRGYSAAELESACI